MGNFLDKTKLLEKEDLEIVKVELPSGDFVYVKQMTGHDRDKFEHSLIKEVKNSKGVVDYERAIGDFRAKLAVMTLCDEQGTLLLAPTDYLRLSTNMSAKSLETIVNVAQELNKISEEDKEALTKNSDAGETGSSISDSVEN